MDVSSDLQPVRSVNGVAGGVWPNSDGLAAVTVLEADDVVFAEIAAGLHFDQLQRLAADILQPVLGAQRDEGRFIFAAARKPCRHR